MAMRRLTVHLHLWFSDIAAENHDDAADAVKQALVEMHDHCQAQLAEALAEIGATDVKLETIVF
jgi:hypothetical protein